jgi:cell wall-associated NlpC family hydrolase
MIASTSTSQPFDASGERLNSSGGGSSNLGLSAARQAVIDESLTWLKTPWRHAAAVKGAGVDCGRIVIEIYANCGLIARFTPDPYPQDFAIHSNEERFLANIERYACRVDKPLQGDIAVWKFGRCFSHAAIVVDYPTIIHAKIDEGVLLDLADQGDLAGREVRFYSVFTGSSSSSSNRSPNLGLRSFSNQGLNSVAGQL